MKDIVDTLDQMAHILETKWRESEDAALDAQLVGAYVAVCAELRAQRPFIEIGTDIIRKSDIIRVQIFEANLLYDYKHIELYTRDVESEGENCGSSSRWILYRYDSEEAKLLLEWLATQTEITIG